MKTTAEYAKDASVIGLTGAAKKAAIKILHDADRAAMPVAPRPKLPTMRELAQRCAEYDAAFHDIKIEKETEKAVVLLVTVDFCDIERDQSTLVWLPKSVLKNGQALGWILTKKLAEVEASAKSAKLGSVAASFE